jgi:hypothetical protein
MLSIGPTKMTLDYRYISVESEIYICAYMGQYIHKPRTENEVFQFHRQLPLLHRQSRVRQKEYLKLILTVSTCHDFMKSRQYFDKGRNYKEH